MLDILREEIKSCTKCSLCKDMPGTKPVPGQGSKSRIMIVGEALGKDESFVEEPFVGRCGKLLTKMLSEAGIDREKVYVTNVVKCRPTKNGGTCNRAPTNEEIGECKEWLYKEILEVNPEVVITLGKVPTYTLLRETLKKSFRLIDVVGEYTRVYGYNVIPAYHPSFIMGHGRKKLEEEIEIFRKVANDTK